VEAPACGRAEAVYEGLATLVDDAADDAVNHIEKLRRQAKAQLSSHKLKEVRPHSSPSHSRSRSRSRSSRRCALTLTLALAVVLALAIAIAPILTQP
jgi:type VI protein secretion system component VasF